MIATSASTDVLRHGWLDAAATLAPDIPEIADLLSARLNEAIASGQMSEDELMHTIAEVEATASRVGSTSGPVLARRLRRTVYEYLLALDANTAVDAQNAAVAEQEEAAAAERAALAAAAAEEAAAAAAAEQAALDAAAAAAAHQAELDAAAAAHQAELDAAAHQAELDAAAAEQAASAAAEQAALEAAARAAADQAALEAAAAEQPAAAAVSAPATSLPTITAGTDDFARAAALFAEFEDNEDGGGSDGEWRRRRFSFRRRQHIEDPPEARGVETAAATAPVSPPAGGSAPAADPAPTPEAQPLGTWTLSRPAAAHPSPAQPPTAPAGAEDSSDPPAGLVVLPSQPAATVEAAEAEAPGADGAEAEARAAEAPVAEAPVTEAPEAEATPAVIDKERTPEPSTPPSSSPQSPAVFDLHSLGHATPAAMTPASEPDHAVAAAMPDEERPAPVIDEPAPFVAPRAGFHIVEDTDPVHVPEASNEVVEPMVFSNQPQAAPEPAPMIAADPPAATGGPQAGPAVTPADPLDPASWRVRHPTAEARQIAEARGEAGLDPATQNEDPFELDSRLFDMRRKIQDRLRRKRCDEAAALLQLLAQETGGRVVAELAMDAGDRCRALGKNNAALNCYLAASRADPVFELPLSRLADICIDDQDIDLAVSYLERIARLHRLRGDERAALRVYRRVVTVAPYRDDILAMLMNARNNGQLDV